MNSNLHSLSRRSALKTTVLFGSSLFVGGMARKLEGVIPTTNFAGGGMDILAFGDYGSRSERQKQVAQTMNDFAGKLKNPLTAVLALGDNFYGELQPDHFEARFEKMYSKEHLNCPFYAILGNHDYGPGYDSNQGRPKADMQLNYARENPDSRWKLPAKWYSFELGPADNPLVKVVYLDGNYWEGALTPQEKLAQRRWLEEEMAKPVRAKWLWLASHYPIISDTAKPDRKTSETLLKNWGKYFESHDISLYLAGHDHNLQHLRAASVNTDFLVSGGGGQHRYDVDQSERGFGMRSYGFHHIHVEEDKLMVQIINSEGERIHAFERERNGKMRVLNWHH